MGMLKLYYTPLQKINERMPIVKKILLILFAFSLAVLSSCGQQAPEEGSHTSYIPDTLESYDNESVFVPSSETSEEGLTSDAPSDTNSNAEENPSAGFVIKDKKYAFKGNDLVILSVENQTKTNYSIAITGSYLDKDGNVLQTETQTFEGFSAGLLNYFLFQPGIAFDRFEYTVETEMFDGVCLIDSYEIRSAELKEVKMIATEEPGDSKNYPSIVVSYQEYSTYDKNIEVVRYVIVIDSNDNVYYVQLRHSEVYPKAADQGWNIQKLCYEKADTIVWPDELKGDVKILFAITEVKLRGEG